MRSGGGVRWRALPAKWMGSKVVGHAMKKTVFATAMLGSLAVAGLVTPALADGEESSGISVTGTVTLTSDYRFRGVSQTDKEAALQGSVDLAAGGFFAGVWASNIDFDDEATYDSGVEIDLYAGYTLGLSENTEATIKGVYYWYADADAPVGFPEYDYFELIGSLSHNFGKTTGSIEVAWSPDFFLEVGDAFAVTGGLAVPLWENVWFFDGIEASGHLGYQSFDDDALEDYTYWDLGLTASFGMFALDVRYIDTDVDDAVCFDLCDATVVVSGTISIGE